MGLGSELGMGQSLLELELGLGPELELELGLGSKLELGLGSRLGLGWPCLGMGTLDPDATRTGTSYQRRAPGRRHSLCRQLSPCIR